MIRVLIGICLAILPTTSQAQQDFSVEKEAALGKQLARDVRSRTKPVDEEQVQQYATSIGVSLASHAPSPFPWTFEVVTGLNSRPPYKPLPIPGGYIFIPAELLLTAQNEREFAGMLAHAMAHQVARDTTRFVIPAGSYSTIPLVLMGESSGLVMPRAFMPVQKAKEEAASRLATEILQDAGLNERVTDSSFQVVQNRLRIALPAPAQRPVPSLFPR